VSRSVDAAFGAETLRFLQELSANNNREWFNANKSRYESLVLDPSLAFIQSMQRPLETFAPHFTAVPKRVGGSLMRVYRDTRFGRKSEPYKTNIGIQFRHERAKDVHSPGYYIHIEPGEVFIGVGMWRPEPPALAAIRTRIADRGPEWRAASRARSFVRHFEFAGETLVRPPRGYGKDHPAIEDIKRKDFIAIKQLGVRDPLAPGFRSDVIAAFRAATPYMQFLCKAVGIPF